MKVFMNDKGEWRTQGAIPMSKVFPREERPKRTSIRSQGKCFFSALVVGVTAALSLSTAYAASVTQTQDEDAAMCADFTRMVKAANLDALPADELCVFRYESLPPLSTSGFSFPTWRQLNVVSAVAEEMKMHKDNVLERDKNEGGLLARNLTEAARSAANEGNLIFATTEVKLEDHSVMTVERMDVRKCSKTTFAERLYDQSVHRTPYIEYSASPWFAMYLDADRSKPIPVTPTPQGGQLALWRGKRWLKLTITPRWVAVASPPVLVASLSRFRRMPEAEVPYGRIQEHVMSYHVCETQVAR